MARSSSTGTSYRRSQPPPPTTTLCSDMPLPLSRAALLCCGRRAQGSHNRGGEAWPRPWPGTFASAAISARPHGQVVTVSSAVAVMGLIDFDQLQFLKETVL
jgi:hypothetical protein